jgi:DNA repair protein RadC
MKGKNISLFGLTKNQTEFPKEKITSALEASNFIKRFYSDDIDIFESAFILLLNRQNVTIGYAKISQGGIAGTVIDTKIVCKYAVDSLASGVILAHNHPSGNLKASESDIFTSKKIENALSILDTQLLDSLILTSDGYLSLKEENLI